MSDYHNIHAPTVRNFGEEWGTFRQDQLSENELNEVFQQYFRIFPWDALPENPVGFDVGCGTGNFALKSAKKGARVLGIDFAEEAIKIAKNKVPMPHAIPLALIPDDISLADISYYL